MQVSLQLPDSNPGRDGHNVSVSRPEPGCLARAVHRCIGEKLDATNSLSSMSRLRARRSTHDIPPELWVDADRAITSVQFDPSSGKLFRQRIQILVGCGGKIDLNNVSRRW